MRLSRFCYLVLPLAMAIGSGCQMKDPKYQQYFVEGEQLYGKHCSNCHQKNGTGLGLVYPPLAASDYVEKNFDKVGCLIKYGAKGDMSVNGDVYHQPMPALPLLTELEIAEILTYVGNSWGHQKGLVDVRTVGRTLGTCNSK